MSIFPKRKLDIQTKAGFTILYKTYVKFVFRTCYRYLGDVAASENITAEIFTSVWERRKTLHQDAWQVDSWERYLSQAAKHKIFNHIRIKKQSDAYVTKVLQDAPIFNHATEEDYQFEELANQIDTLVDQLPPKCQYVFRLSREKGLSNKEIAQHLSISDNAVKKHIAKALSHLRENLADYQLLKRTTDRETETGTASAADRRRKTGG
ncbi:MAG: RNA polymerase sigma-70 factor [Bacteroidota bacterium]